MSDASEWIVVLIHNEYLSTPQFVPVESVIQGSLWRVVGQSCATVGHPIRQSPARGVGEEILILVPPCYRLIPAPMLQAVLLTPAFG
jgi:hypothetical protein